MEKELDIEWKKPVTNKVYVLFALFIFLIGGFAMGFAFGGNAVQTAWEEYNINLQERIEADCICINRTLPCGIPAPLFINSKDLMAD